MSATKRLIVTFIAGGTITKGMPVKFGADSKHVVQATLNTERVIGWCQTDSVSSGDGVEIALPGGGAFALAGETISKGKLVVAGVTGAVQTNSSGDCVGGMAMEDAVLNDIFPIIVLASQATGADN